MNPPHEHLLCYELDGSHYGLPFIHGETAIMGSAADCEVHVTGTGVPTKLCQFLYREDGQVDITALSDVSPITSGAVLNATLTLRPPFELKAGTRTLTFTLVPLSQIDAADAAPLLAPTISAPEKSKPAPVDPRGTGSGSRIKLDAAAVSTVLPPLPPLPAAKKAEPSTHGLTRLLTGGARTLAATFLLAAALWWGIYSMEVRHPQMARHEFMRQQAASQLQEIKDLKARMATAVTTAKADLDDAKKRLTEATAASEKAVKELAATRAKHAPTPPARDRPMGYLDVRGWLAGQSQGIKPALTDLTPQMISEELIVALQEQGLRHYEAGQTPRCLLWLRAAHDAAVMGKHDRHLISTITCIGLAQLIDNSTREALDSLGNASSKLTQPRAQPYLAAVLNLALADARMRTNLTDQSASVAEEARVSALGANDSRREAAACVLLGHAHTKQAKHGMAAKFYEDAARAVRSFAEWSAAKPIDTLEENARRQDEAMRASNDRSSVHEELEQLVRQSVQIENIQDINGIMRSYAQVVDYFDKGNISRSSIEEDKLKYFSRYPHAIHTITSPIIFTDLSDGSVLTEFTTTYHLINTAGESRRGTTAQQLTFRRQFFQWSIVRQRAASTPDGPRPVPAAPSTNRPQSNPPPSSGNSLRDRARRFNDL